MSRLLILFVLVATGCSPVDRQGSGDSAKIVSMIVRHEANLPRERNPTCLSGRIDALAFDDKRQSLQYARTLAPSPIPRDERARKAWMESLASPRPTWRRPGTSIAYDWEAGVALDEATDARLAGAIASIIKAPPQKQGNASIDRGLVPWSLRNWGRWGFCAAKLSLSAPAFHDDLAFVETAYVCGGLCGYGWLYALRREGEDWKIVAIALTWVS